MIKSQTIYLDKTPYNTQSGSLLNSGIEILNLIVNDGTPQTDCQFVGDKFEYKPLVWLEYERETISRLKELNFILLKGSEKIQTSLKKMFPFLTINFYQNPLLSMFQFFEDAKKNMIDLHETRNKNCYFSIGTMKLQRFYLAWYCQRAGIDNFGCPEVESAMLDNFVYQIERMLGTKFDLSKFNNSSRRLFGNVSESEFSAKQMSRLADSRINIVSQMDYCDYVTHHYDEKTSLPIVTKTLPFFFDAKGANANIKYMGFTPYVGFDYSAEQIDNFVERWETLLNANKKFFLDDTLSKDIYDMNKNIIDNNYRVLMETNWKEKALEEFSKLPENIRSVIKEKVNIS